MAGDHGVRSISGEKVDEAAPTTSGRTAEPRLLYGWQANAGAVGYYRIWQPLIALRQLGYSTAWGPILPAELRPGTGDVELKQATTFIGQITCGPARTPQWLALAEEGVRLCYELDDDIWHVDSSNPSYSEWQKPDMLASAERCMAASTGIITTRKPLADLIRSKIPDVPIYVIPNYVPKWLTKWRHPLHPIVREHMAPVERTWQTVKERQDDLKLPALAEALQKQRESTRPLVVGWAGSAHHAMDWEHLAPRFAQWARAQQPRVVVHAMGGIEHLAVVRRELPNGTTMQGWMPDVEEWMRSVCFDIAVLPLRRHPFNESKSWIAALVYAALGIPVVASDVGPYHDFIIDGETGFLFRTPGQMASRLTELVRNPDLRQTMADNARYIASHHTYEGNAWKWAQALSLT